MRKDAISLVLNSLPARALRALALTVSLAALLAACSNLHFPGVHRIVVQQGNVVTQAMIDKLKTGMSKNQVRYVMGNSVVDNPFNHDRWDYVYTADIRGKDYVERRLSLYFKDGKLVRYEGNYLTDEDRRTGGVRPKKDQAIERIMQEQKSDTAAAEQKEAGDKSGAKDEN